MKLSGKTILLTGASKGLGRELARVLDQKNGRLLLVARDANSLASLQRELQTPGSRFYPCDLSDSADRERLIARIQEDEATLDLLIHNAGAGSHSRLDQLTAGEVQSLLALNTVAPLALTVGLLPLLPAGEAAGIVAIGSVAGELVLPGMSLYSSSKAALHAFSRAAAIELQEKGHFSLLVILGPLRGTQFSDAISHRGTKRPGWYRGLDVDASQAAAQIVGAIEQERSRLVLPWWYAPIIAAGKLLAPLTRLVMRHAYNRYR